MSRAYSQDLQGQTKSLFETLDLPQKPEASRILSKEGQELFFWSPDAHHA